MEYNFRKTYLHNKSDSIRIRFFSKGKTNAVVHKTMQCMNNDAYYSYIDVPGYIIIIVVLERPKRPIN
jgi:hypothetical protein